MKKTVVLGVTSGIAAYKTLDLVKKLKAEDIDVFVIMTDHAAKMVDPKEFEKTSEHKVSINLFERNFDYKSILKARKVDHIELADLTNVMIIAPATANIIAKLANGDASDFLTTTALAVTAPIIICPSMNVNMWNNPIVKENVTKLKTLGYQIIEPTSGMLACGYEGEGRLADVESIKNEILKQLNYAKSLAGKKVVVTAGGTIEKIDDVRFIANRASGKMGAAIADECYLRGAEVLLLRAKNAVKPRYLIKEKIFETSDDLLNLVKKYVPNYDVFYHTAAVSDFKPSKIKGKVSSNINFNLKLTPAVKISDQIKKINSKIKLIVFKAEYRLKEQELLKKAQKKLKESKADAIVANDVSRHDRGFEADTNEVIVLKRSGESKKIALNQKKEVAAQIIEYLYE